MEEIAENAADGIRISEFPVTMEAAKAAKAAGMQVIAGAPNIVRGGSHSGNVAAVDLLRAGAVDAFASDYVPPSLIEAAFQCAREDEYQPARRPWPWLPTTPPECPDLPDRGRLEPGCAPIWCACACMAPCPSCVRSGARGERVI